jgi:hypothetical protein
VRGAVAALLIAGCQFSAVVPQSQPGTDAASDGPRSIDAARDGTLAIDAAMPDAPRMVPPPALVQQTTATANNTNAPLVATLPARPANGALLVMIGAAEHGGLTSVTGGGVQTWTRATRALQNTNIEIWYGISDGSSAAVTATFPAYTLPIWMLVTEWSNMASTNLLDKTVSTSGTSSPAGAGSITTTSASELVIFGVGDQTPNTFGAPQGTWNALTTVSSNATVQDVWYLLAPATGTFAPGVSETHHSWDAALASFRAL